MATIHWKKGISGQFNTASDWNGTVPTANDDVIIDAAGTYTVTASASHTIKSLRTVSSAILAVTGGKFAIEHGTSTGTNAGTISVADGAALAIGGPFNNSGKISLNSTGHSTDLIIGTNVTLHGRGRITLSAVGHNFIVGNKPSNPFLGSLVTLTNADNVIAGAGSIGGPNLALVNEATIAGDSAIAPLSLNTGVHQIKNAGVIEGTTVQGVVIVSDVANSGTIEASGLNANLIIDGTVTGTASGIIKTSGVGAHIDLASATLAGGTLQVGSGGSVQSVARSGLSVISDVGVAGSGTLQANSRSALGITNSTIATTVSLISNGNGSKLSIDGTVGAVAGTISGGEIEFQGASASTVTFAQGLLGTPKLDSSFTGTVAGFAGAVPVSFTNFFAFGDSTIDSGALQYLSPDLPAPPNPGLTDRLQNALAAGGTSSPVGVGLMNTQRLAAAFGLSATTAYTTGGSVGGGGTNYAIAGALNAPDAGSGIDPGNGSVSNLNQVGQTNPNPQLLSTVDQIESYLNSVGFSADPLALYLISSGGNDFSYATKFITDPDPNVQLAKQEAYLSAQAQSLAGAIEELSANGGEHIIVNASMNNHGLAIFYSQQLFADLDAAGIPYIKSDVHAMVQDVLANPTTYGFTSATVLPGIVGTQTASALVELDTANSLTGWGLWGANTTVPDSSKPLNQQYAYLSSADAEETQFFSDDQHLSAAGQQIQANFNLNLLTDDAIDVTDLTYVFGSTTASFSGTSAGGVLTVSNGTQSANLALVGNYTAATFVTASDGAGGTLVMNQSSAAQQ